MDRRQEDQIEGRAWADRRDALQSFRVSRVDWSDVVQCADWLRLLDLYARDPMGGGHGLSPYAKEHLVGRFSQLSHAFALIAYCDGEAVAIANCIESFSTFACAGIVNIHDFAVAPGWRGRGIGRSLMQAIETEALRLGCCKMTLEVLEGNRAALALYSSVGFARYQLDPASGGALFLEKQLKFNTY